MIHRNERRTAAGLALLFSVVTLAACGDEDMERQPETDRPEAAEMASVEANPTDEIMTDTTAEPSGLSSRYTDAAASDCTTLERETEEGSYIRQRCPGIGGYPLIVEEGDGRMFVHAGNKPEASETMSPFNTLSPRVEWRMDGAEPVAIIYRLVVATADSGRDGDTQLFVSKIGKGDDLGCVMAKIAGSYPDANATAREVADEAAGFRCGRDAQQSFGDVIR